MIALLGLYCSVILTACGPQIKANGGVVPDEAVIPSGIPLMESQVAGYVDDLYSEAKQCRANFK